jgi:hypothetical protein
MPLPWLIAARRARRLAPLAMMAYERWQRMSPEEKERYMKMARQNVDRARAAVEQRRGRRGGGPPA